LIPRGLTELVGKAPTRSGGPCTSLHADQLAWVDRGMIIALGGHWARRRFRLEAEMPSGTSPPLECMTMVPAADESPVAANQGTLVGTRLGGPSTTFPLAARVVEEGVFGETVLPLEGGLGRGP